MKNSRLKRFVTRSHTFPYPPSSNSCLSYIFHAVLLTTQTWHRERWPLSVSGYLCRAYTSYCAFCKNIHFLLKHLPILETVVYQIEFGSNCKNAVFEEVSLRNWIRGYWYDKKNCLCDSWIHVQQGVSCSKCMRKLNGFTIQVRWPTCNKMQQVPFNNLAWRLPGICKNHGHQWWSSSQTCLGRICMSFLGVATRHCCWMWLLATRFSPSQGFCAQEGLHPAIMRQAWHVVCSLETWGNQYWSGQMDASIIRIWWYLVVWGE